MLGRKNPTCQALTRGANGEAALDSLEHERGLELDRTHGGRAVRRRDGGDPQSSELICAATRSMRTPWFGQPPKWCNPMTLCVRLDSTGEPDEPPSVSQ
ncbi:hypothetical protein SAMN05421810_101478 [Amycolatopsis arida]|uniref:Uncharacterized protein n=1 Tax=Amycolatopsis arida TaxID=587909 RepID=A0A1I5LB14_9PSEU|nr:hypothetical protein CLV69_104111 [Amycolatopsis arida]SFO94447.1 hypothetical protein SAMN05421810_101478 [Amycolatopsis arida]